MSGPCSYVDFHRNIRIDLIILPGITLHTAWSITMQSDSLEHYCCCPVVVRFLRRKLHYRGDVDKGHLLVLGVNTGPQSHEDTCRLAMWNFCTYKAYNHLRHRQAGLSSEDEVHGLMLQFLRDGVGSYPGAASFLENCWRQDFRIARQRAGGRL